MALTVGSGPFGTKNKGQFNFDTGVLQSHTLYFEDSPRRVRAVFNGEVVADSEKAKMLHETGHLPLYYFPEEDVNWDLLHETAHTTHCPFKGDAAYWSVRVGDREAENAVWGYPEPLEQSPWLAGYVSIYFNSMDRWMEEEEEITAHPRDPYHRVDILESSRYVKVTVGGQTVAETERPRVLFETGLPPRYYIPPEDVNPGLLADSDTQTHCPYKGAASYRSVEANGETLADAAFYYPEPLPEAGKIGGYLCFLGEGVETEVDGR
ncbi:MAG: DUF427 domain-containing protein [Rubrobacteraceae bacterium]